MSTPSDRRMLAAILKKCNPAEKEWLRHTFEIACDTMKDMDDANARVRLISAELATLKPKT